ncbi:MAG: glycosyltransferase [Planctomycetes bacterium]|nr:glycosyltransferase [Planctomycetota bacterium]
MPKLAVLLDTWNAHGGGLEQYLLHVLPLIVKRGYPVLLVAENAQSSPPAGCEAVNLTKGRWWPRPLRDKRNQQHAQHLIRQWQADSVLTMRTLAYPQSVHLPIGGSPRDIPRRKKISNRTASLIRLEENAMSQAKLILPSSAMVEQQIDVYLNNRQQTIALPLLESPKKLKSQFSGDNKTSLRLAHCGRDPRRHGLLEAYDWFNTIKAARPNSTLCCFSKTQKHASSLLGKSLTQLANEGVTIRPWETGFRRVIHEFDLLLHPSLYDSFSFVCLEAAAAGVPIICSKSVGVADQLPTSICQAIELNPSDQQLLVAASTLLQGNHLAATQQIHDEFSSINHVQTLLNALF